ncbi:MAG TPA: hypothetical protein DIV54_02140, partial [Verrucomicrobiales bacterium]|nr:hypothetical protein [Verrucomicrobiales bacterium]
RKEVNIMMTGMTSLGTRSIMFPQDRPIHLADGYDIFSVGDTEENQSLVLGLGRREEKER